jgi:hypothetical protein
MQPEGCGPSEFLAIDNRNRQSKILVGCQHNSDRTPAIANRKSKIANRKSS